MSFVGITQCSPIPPLQSLQAPPVCCPSALQLLLHQGHPILKPTVSQTASQSAHRNSKLVSSKAALAKGSKKRQRARVMGSKTSQRVRVKGSKASRKAKMQRVASWQRMMLPRARRKEETRRTNPLKPQKVPHALTSPDAASTLTPAPTSTPYPCCYPFPLLTPLLLTPLLLSLSIAVSKCFMIPCCCK